MTAQTSFAYDASGWFLSMDFEDCERQTEIRKKDGKRKELSHILSQVCALQATRTGTQVCMW